MSRVSEYVKAMTVSRGLKPRPFTTANGDAFVSFDELGNLYFMTSQRNLARDEVLRLLSWLHEMLDEPETQP